MTAPSGQSLQIIAHTAMIQHGKYNPVCTFSFVLTETTPFTYSLNSVAKIRMPLIKSGQVVISQLHT